MLNISVFARDYIGESADYILSKKEERTSRLIKEADVNIKIVGLEKEEFKILIDLDLDLLFIGKHRQQNILYIDKQYFSNDFFTQLKQERLIHFDKLSIELIDEIEGLYKIKIYDIKSIDEDIEFTLLVTPGIAVLGALKIDAEFNYNGFRGKIGLDLNQFKHSH
jgi:hypothetical protein